MTLLREVREVTRPIEEVFEVISDFSTTEAYDPGVSRAVRLDPVGPGARFEIDAVFLGRTLPMNYRIVVYEPPTHLVLEGDAAGSSARDDIVLTPTASGTRITWVLELRLKGMSRLFEPLLRPFFRKLGREALDGLSRHLNTRADQAETHD